MKQKERSRSSREDVTGLDKQSEVLLSLKVDSEFIGYNVFECMSNIVAIIQDEELKEQATGKMGLVLDKTPFYAESGGQVSDKGKINDIKVEKVIKAPHGQHIHFIDTNETISLGSCHCKISRRFREKVSVNHSATHLLNYALKQHFSDHVKQQGSYVTYDYLRFDFTHFDSVTDEDIIQIEELVNSYLQNWHEIKVETMKIDEAKKLGAAALFGEKYGDVVRVVKLGDSLELCGGCHIADFAEINSFAIASVESKGSGVYRIIASTNDSISSVLRKSFNHIIDMYDEQISKVGDTINDIDDAIKDHVDHLELADFKKKKDKLVENISSYKDRVDFNELKNSLSKYKKNIDKSIKDLKEKIAVSSTDISADIKEVCGIKYSIVKFDNIDVNTTKTTIDNLFADNDLDLMFVANTQNNVVFIAKASDKAVEKGINCGNLVKEAAIICEGNGGGRPNFAQAGGKNNEKVNEAVETIEKIVKSIC